MIVRIVKLHIQHQFIDQFIKQFKESKDRIKSSRGNRLLELYQDTSDPTVFFTYSYWETAEDLEFYRQSEFFKHLWRQTKRWFSDKPMAWSVNKLVSLSNNKLV